MALSISGTAGLSVPVELVVKKKPGKKYPKMPGYGK